MASMAVMVFLAQKPPVEADFCLLLTAFSQPDMLLDKFKYCSLAMQELYNKRTS